MPKRSCLTNLIVAEELIAGINDQGELVDVVKLDFSKAFVSVCHRLVGKQMLSMGVHPKITDWVEEYLKNKTFRVNFDGDILSEGIVESGMPQDYVLRTPSAPDLYKWP